MLTYNTMRFGTDTFNIIEDSRTALLIAKNPIAANFEYTHIEQFIIDYDQPTGTDIRFAFYLPTSQGKTMCRINPSTGNLIVLNPDQGWVFEPNADDVLNYGHTVDDLLAMTNFSFSKALYPVIALKTTKSAVPKVKLAIKFFKHVIKTEKEYFTVRLFDEPVRYLAASHEKEITGDAAITVSAACKTSADGDWSDFGDLSSILNKNVYGVKFRRLMHVDSTDGSDKILSRIRSAFTQDVECNAFGDFADIYSITKNYYLPLKYCVVVVKHNELSSGAKIKAYVKLDPSINWKVYTIGTGTGSSQTYDMPVNAFVDVNNLVVYVNGTRTTDYRLYVKDNKITINAASGATITASSNYQLKTEEWIELDADATQHDISDGKFTTRFSSKITKSGVYVSAIRLRLFRGTQGETKSLTLPITPTGEEQSYRFSDSDITLSEFAVFDPATGKYLYHFFNVGDDNDTAGSNADCEFSFNPKKSLLTFTAPAGNYQIIVKYYKNATRPIVYSWTAGYCV